MTIPYIEYPQDYEIATLEANKQNGVIVKVSSGGTPSTQTEEYWNGNIPWLTPKEICQNFSGIFVSKTERHLTHKGIKKSGASILTPGTVMLTKRAPVGVVAINTIPMSTNQGFLNFRCGQKLNPVFLYYWLIANKPYLNAIANGSTYPELYKNDLFEFIIGFPPLEEQKQITKFLFSLEIAESLGTTLEYSEDNYEHLVQIRKETRFISNMKNKMILNAISGKIRFIKGRIMIVEQKN